MQILAILLGFLIAEAIDGGGAMDPNGIVLGDGVILSDYTGCVDPNG